MMRDTQALIEMAFDYSPDQTFWLDAAGRLIHVNQTACLSLGYSKETLLTMKIYDLCHHMDQQTWQKSWELLREQRRLRFETQQRRHDGSLLEVEVLASRLVLAGEELSCCHIRDIGRFKEALQEKDHWLQVARRNSEHFQALADIGLMTDKNVNEICDFALEEAVRITASEIGYIYFYSEQDQQFTLYSWSRSVMRQCTITSPQMIYKLEATGIWGEAVRQRGPIMINDFAAANPLKKGLPEGHAPLNRFLTIPLFDQQKIVAVIGVGNKAAPYDDADVQQLQIFMESIWRLVGRRSMDEQLCLARDAAEAANRSKSDFLASMSHEIRTSMNGVIGMTELLRTTTLDAQQQEFLNLLQGSADGLLFLINDILDLSRIEAGKLSLCMAEVSLGQILHEIAESQQYMVGLKNLQLRVDLDAALPTRVIGDAHRLKQILLNLLVNAIKFTDRGQITLRGHLLEETARETLVRLSIADTGIGMDEEALRRIFAPYEQADTETARRFGGSGLGLTICKQLTELFGGEITAESTLGQGSVFHVTLPFKKGSTGAEDSSEGRGSSLNIEAFAPCRILIAEDHESIQSMLDTLLQHLGYQTVCCSDGKSALEHVQNAPFDLILMDIRMPVMDGLQALRHIRAWEKKTGRHQPIIAFTAHAMSGDREKFLRAGFDDYLAKPLKMQELTGMLQELLAAGKPKENLAAAIS